MCDKVYRKLSDQSTLGVDFTNVFCARFLQNVTRKETYVWKTRAKNARENVGEIDSRNDAENRRSTVLVILGQGQKIDIMVAFEV